LEPGEEKWHRFSHGPEFLWKPEGEWPPPKSGLKKAPKTEPEVSINAIGAMEVSGQNFTSDWALHVSEKVEG